MNFRIYRVKERAWWAEGLHGDTQDESYAGVFDLETTALILDQANDDGREDIAVPVNRVFFDSSESIRRYAQMMEPTLPDLKVGRFLT